MAALETLATARTQVFTELREDLEQRGNSSANISRILNCLTVSTEGSKANHGLTLIKAGYKLLQRPPTPQEHAHLSILG
ncbi:uncharacterized protein APUU_51575S [Aspergillus puulaauensis]|uniref:Uncharacterized protein n=1 Tax=Aspergillus puulaauensis TaxID=1220207 RepID=A0A7R7XU59_9EURO|nr:uncharacterized protein APUU_51575S [Aspergillus puulaauensis]BCS26864.1 hypothetical protein APUU_51575S [Aspergillus puulaauensis]